MMSQKYAYWISTAMLALLYVGSAVWYIFDGETARHAYRELGYPTYLVTLLIVLKPLGAAAILSRINIALSDLAYAGFFFHLSLALLAHIVAGAGHLPALIGMAALFVSFLTQNSARGKASPHAPLPSQSCLSASANEQPARG